MPLVEVSDAPKGRLVEVGLEDKPQGKSVGGFLQNRLTSEAKMVGGAAQAVMHPIQTAKSLLNIGLGVVERTSPLINLLKITGVSPQTIGHESYADVVAKEYIDRYGSPSKLLNTAYTDPTGMGLDALMVAEPMAGLGRKGVAEASKLASETNVMRKATAPSGTLERMTAQASQAKGLDRVSKLLDLNLAKDIGAGGGGSASQMEALNLIKKTKNPQDIVNNFAVEQGKVLAERDALVAANNRPIPVKAVAERAKLILGRDIANATSKDAKALRAAFKDELSSNAYKGEFDAVAANKRKSYLYDETHPTQAKQGKGISITMASEAIKVKDAFAQALKELVAQIHPDIPKLNTRWGAIEEAKNSAIKLTESLKENSPNNVLASAAAYSAGRPSIGQAGTAAVRMAAKVIQDRQNSISKLTGDIEKFAKQAQEASYKSRLKQMERLIKPEGGKTQVVATKPERGFSMKDVEPKAPTEGGLLTGETRKGLTGPAKREALTGPPKQGLLEYDLGAGFLTKEQALKENPLFGYELVGSKKVIGEPVGGIKSSYLSKGGFDTSKLSKSTRDKLTKFNKRNRIKND